MKQYLENARNGQRSIQLSIMRRKFSSTEACTNFRTLIFIFVLLLLIFLKVSEGQTYNSELELYESVLGNSSAYNTRVRPLLDQSKVINISVEFSLIAILSLDDKRQELVTNAFVYFSWIDEIVPWNPLLNGIYMMHVYPRDVWRPRMILVNTLGARDLFDDDYSPTMILPNGNVSWVPGSLFPTSCKLYLKKYPFDRQTCSMELYAMGWFINELQFQAHKVDLDDYVVNGEWEIVSIGLTAVESYDLAGFKVDFVIQRRPGFFIINILMPVVLLSFLNIVVFLIPVECGEKISYGITVLLAMTVFMSIVSNMLPRSSDAFPLVTIYLFVLLIISVLTVMVAIIIVWLHHKDEEETKRQKATSTFKDAFKKIRVLNRATAPITKVMSDQDSADQSPAGKINQGASLLEAVKKLGNPEKVLTPVPNEERRVNKYKIIGRHIDIVAFFTFTFVWLAVTLGFTLVLSS